MIVKVIANSPIGGSVQRDFTRRITYICRSAAYIKTRNLAGTWEDAPFQMSISAGLKPGLRAPCYHLILSWSEFETPSEAEMIEAADEVMASLGAQDHQYVIGLHLGKVGHAHIVVSLVHPLSGIVLSRSHDYQRLELACRQIEWRKGWAPDRGRFATEIRENEVRLVPQPKRHWAAKLEARARGLRHDPRAVRGHEWRTGLANLRDLLSPEQTASARQVIRAATTWEALHVGLQRCGLQYSSYVTGARITQTGSGAFMRACDLGTAFALPRLEMRIGPFAPASVVKNQTPSPHVLKEIAAREEVAARRQARTKLYQKQKNEREHLRQTTMGFPGSVRQAFRWAQRQLHFAQRKRFNKSNPLPKRGDLNSTLTDNARQTDARRYRHVLRRQTEMRLGKLANPVPPDHTACRQIWALEMASSETGEDRKSAYIGHIGSDRFLLAHRNLTGQIVGFDTVQEGDGAATIYNMSGETLGVVAVGSKMARTCVITAEFQVWSNIARYSPDLHVFLVPPDPSPRVLEQLQAMTKDRSVYVSRSTTEPRLADAIKRHIPRADFLSLDAPQGAQSTMPAEPPDAPDIGGDPQDDPEASL